MLSHLTLQLESIDGPEKERRHLSKRGGAHDTTVSHSPKSVSQQNWPGNTSEHEIRGDYSRRTLIRGITTFCNLIRVPYFVRIVYDLI